MQERSHKFDTIKGIMIFFVVFCHCLELLYAECLNSSITKYIYYIVYSFHMPVFVYISGYFSYKLNDEKYEYNSISRYLIPYVIINTIAQLIFSKHISILYSEWTLWFLLSIFFWRVGTKIIKEIKVALLFLVLMSIFVGGISGIGGALSLSRTICFFPYYFAGYLCHSKTDWHTKSISKFITIPAFLISLFTASFLAYKNVSHMSFYLSASYSSMNQTFAEGALIRSVIYVLGFIGIIFIFSIIGNTDNIVSTLGKYTMPVYLCHSFVIRFLKSINISFSNQCQAILISMAMSFVMCILFGNKFVNSIYNFVFSNIAKVFLIDHNDVHYSISITESRKSL